MRLESGIKVLQDVKENEGIQISRGSYKMAVFLSCANEVCRKGRKNKCWQLGDTQTMLLSPLK